MTRRHAKRERERFIVLHAALRIYIDKTRQHQHYLPEEFLSFLRHTSSLKDVKSSLPHQLGNGILCSIRSQLASLGGLRYTDPGMLVLCQALWEEASTATHLDTQAGEDTRNGQKGLYHQECSSSSTPFSCISGVMKIISYNRGVNGKAAEQLLRGMSACIREVPLTVTLPTTTTTTTDREEKNDSTRSKVGGDGANSVTGHRINSIPLRLLVALRVLKYQ